MHELLNKEEWALRGQHIAQHQVIHVEVITLEQSSKLFDAKTFGEKWETIVERLQFQAGRMEY
jgi:hypothetical protein